MLVQLIAKLFGGTWRLKEKCRTAPKGPLKKVYTFFYIRSLQANGSWISWDAEFEGTPCFPHGIYGIFISGGAKIGRNCVFFQQTTIGSNTLVESRSLGSPTIGQNCYIGVGAKIIGRVRIGDNVRIGANVVVHKDVPDNAVVLSGEQMVVEKTVPRNNRFYHTYDYQWQYFDNGRWIKESDPETLKRLEEAFPSAHPASSL